MKKPKQWMMWAVSAGCGVIVAAQVYSVVSSRSTSEAQPTRTLPLVVAVTTLNPATVLTEEHLRSIEQPAEEIPTGSFAHPHLVVGRTVRRAIGTNSPILESSLAPVGNSQGLKDLLPPGYRAVGVPVDARGNIQNHLKAGDQVDVMVIMKDEKDIPSSKILLQNVQVLAVPGLKETQENRGSRADTIPVVLAVTPWDAEKLALAVDIGTLQLLLRGYEDMRAVQTSGVTLDTLLPAQGAASQPLPSTYRPVEIIKGQQREHQRFREKASEQPRGNP